MSPLPDWLDRRRGREPYVAPPRLSRRPHRLKIHDRCDGCGARAYVAAEIRPADVAPNADMRDVVGSELMFCAHDFRRFEDAIRAVSIELLDERWVIEYEEGLRAEVYA